MIFAAHRQAAKHEQPGKEPFDFPTPRIASQHSAIPRGHAPVVFVGSDQCHSLLVHELIVRPVAVLRLVADQSIGNIGNAPRFQRGRHQFHLSRRNACCPQGERKTLAARNAHHLGALAPLYFPDASPPFFAGTNVLSTIHPLKSSPPGPLNCCASEIGRRSVTPVRTRSWKRRCAVWSGPHRGGQIFPKCARA